MRVYKLNDAGCLPHRYPLSTDRRVLGSRHCAGCKKTTPYKVAPREGSHPVEVVVGMPAQGVGLWFYLCMIRACLAKKSSSGGSNPVIHTRDTRSTRPPPNPAACPHAHEAPVVASHSTDDLVPHRSFSLARRRLTSLVGVLLHYTCRSPRACTTISTISKSSNHTKCTPSHPYTR